jgi:hypothetical protein
MTGDPDVHYRSLLEHPRWLRYPTVTSALAIAGFLTYVIAYSYAWSFLGSFGATPEEAGLDQPAFIIRVTVFGSILAFLFFIIASLASAIRSNIWYEIRHAQHKSVNEYLRVRFFAPIRKLLRARRRNFLRRYFVKRWRDERLGYENSASLIGRSVWSRIKRRTYWFGTRVGAAVCFVQLVTVVMLSDDLDAVELVLLIFPVQALLLAFLARYRYYVSLVAAGFFILAFGCFAGNISGIAEAKAVQSGEEPGFVTTGIGLHADHVLVHSSSQDDLPRELLLLGQSDRVYLLADSTTLYRVSDMSVTLVYQHPH